MAAPSGSEVWRDYVTNGIPSSGANNPKKSDIRSWASWLESLVTSGVLSSGPWFATKAVMTLGYAANTIAIVYNDPAPANNGLYIKSGASGSGSWNQLTSFLPGYQFVTASPTGESTPNAIVAVTSPRLPAGDGVALVTLVVPATNTASPVTVRFDGGAALSIKTRTGENPDAGELQQNDVVAGFVSGSTFRLISDLNSLRDFQSAKAWANNEEDVPVPADLGGDGSTTFSAKHWAAKSNDDADRSEVARAGSEAARDIAAGYASDAVSQGNVPIYATVVGMPSLEISAGINAIRVNGYHAAGDGGGALYVKVGSEPAHAGKFQTADGAWWELAEGQKLNIEAFGAKGDGSDDAAAINNAILYLSLMGGGTLIFNKPLYRTGATVYRRKNVKLVGNVGSTRIKLLPNANCTIVEDLNFSTWESWTVGSLEDYPVGAGIDGFILDGNCDEQGDVSTTLANQVYGLRTISHRHTIGRVQICNIKGVGFHSKYNSTIQNAIRQTDRVEPYGNPDAISAPCSYEEINVVNCLNEAYVFQGPADINLGVITTNYNGFLGGTPALPVRTSLMFPGEEIHSVRIETNCVWQHINANGAIFGRGLYLNSFVRNVCGPFIGGGSWGTVLIGPSAYGDFSSLTLQQHLWAWNGEQKPYLECMLGTGSGANKGRMHFGSIMGRRLNTENSGGPIVVDNAGNHFDSIRNLGGSAEKGHGLIIGSTSRGTTVKAIHLDSLQGRAHDGTASAAVIIESGAVDYSVEGVFLVNNDRAVVNKGVNSRGYLSGIIRCNEGSTTGQISLEGVVGSSQLASVTAGSGNVALDNLPNWEIEILDGGAGGRFYSKFSGTTTFDMSTTGAKASSPIDHKMWRTPQQRDIKTSISFGGTTWPAFNAGVRTITSAAITPAAFVHTAQAGTVTMSINI